MQAQYEIFADCFHMGNKNGGKFLIRFYEKLPATGSQWAWPEQRGLCGESSSCADLRVGVHLRLDQSFQREEKSTQGATGTASATAGGCSWTVILFYQERSVVVWHWAGIVLLSWVFFFHTSQMLLGMDYETPNLFADCSSRCITVEKMFIWLSLSAQHILTTFH